MLVSCNSRCRPAVSGSRPSNYISRLAGFLAELTSARLHRCHARCRRCCASVPYRPPRSLRSCFCSFCPPPTPHSGPAARPTRPCASVGVIRDDQTARVVVQIRCAAEQTTLRTRTRYACDAFLRIALFFILGFSRKRRSFSACAIHARSTCRRMQVGSDEAVGSE